MAADAHEPADTRSMGIVHSALRRDLERTRLLLNETPPPGDDQRRALAAHLGWMMHFLHLHHTGEDVGLWPLVRSRNPSAAPLLDQMDEDHRRIGPAVTALEEAADRYREHASARDELLAALDRLSEVLLPHLRREELEMMPVVATTLSDPEYRAVEHEYFVAPKGLRELGTEAHWVLDGLPPDGREVMLSVVPAVPRFILLHGFGRAYRRAATRRWGAGAAARVPSLQLSASTRGT
jgi:hypothetical protein